MSSTQRGKRSRATLGVVGRGGGGAGHPPPRVEADQVGVAGQAGADVGQSLGALQAHRAWPQGLQEHPGRLDAGASDRGAMARSQLQALATRVGFGAEGEDRLQPAQDEHGQQRHAQREGQTNADGVGGARGAAGKGVHRGELNRSASARIARIASPADAPSRS